VVLVDTCGWIEWLTDSSLSEKYSKYFTQVESIIVPSSIQYELYKWVRLKQDMQYALEAVALTEQAKVVPLTTAIALSAGDMAIEYKLSFADAIIYATAQFYNAELITSDKHFKSLTNVVYFAK